MKNTKKTSLSEKILFATKSGSLEDLKELIAQLKNVNECNEALFLSAKNGHTEFVKLLIPVSNPKESSNYALRLASLKGHAECVKLLIPVSSPKDNKSLVLRWAAEHGHAKCVELLLPHSDISLWGAEDWNYIRFDMQQVILSYFSKKSLTDNILIDNDQSTKNTKTKKI